ncbi:hypothetical protein ACMFMG_011811 [Clarireedia jacksonii]
MEPFVHFPVQGVIVYTDQEKYRAVKDDRERMVEAIQAIRGLKSTIAELNHLVFPPPGPTG